jgi:hypothetical protein
MLDVRFAAGLTFGFLCSLAALGNVPPAAEAQVPGRTQACVGPLAEVSEDPCVLVESGDVSDCGDPGECSRVYIDGVALDTQAPTDPGTLTWAAAEVWTAANDGAGSGLAADTLDGFEAAALATPAGAVLAFDLPACPSGWTAYAPAAGRNVIGVGAGPGLSTRTLGQTGGEESHVLSTAEMPAHSHTERIPLPQSSSLAVASASDVAGGSRYSVQPSGGAQDGGDLTTGSTGGGAAHNVMDPYVALLYCKKL